MSHTFLRTERSGGPETGSSADSFAVVAAPMSGAVAASSLSGALAAALARLTGTLSGPGLLTGGTLRAALQLRQPAAQLAHGPVPHVLHGDLRVQGLEGQQHLVLAAGKALVVGRLRGLQVGGAAVGGAPVRRAGGHLGQHLRRPGLVGPGHGDGQVLIPGEARGDDVAVQHLRQGLLVVQEAHVQGLGQGGAVVVAAVQGDHPVEPVHCQLQGGVHIHADVGRRGETEPEAPQGQQQTGGAGRRRDQQRPPPGRDLLPAAGLPDQIGQGPLLQVLLRPHLGKGLPHPLIHGPHLPASFAASPGSGSAACRRC